MYILFLNLYEFLRTSVIVLNATSRSQPGTISYDFSYHLRFGKFSAVLTTTGHTVGSFAVCMLKYRVKTTETDKRHVVSLSNVRFSKVPMDFGFHDHDTADQETLVHACVQFVIRYYHGY